MTPAATAADPNRDERHALVHEALSNQQAGGTPVDYDALAKEHPDLVEEIRQLLAVGHMIEFARAETIAHPKMQPSTIHLPSTFGDYELLEEISAAAAWGLCICGREKPDRHVALKMIRARHSRHGRRFGPL